MTYKILDDRPDKCEGCSKPDYPGHFGPSARQITWNNVLELWLCVECQLQWSNWAAGFHETESIKRARKPWFLTEVEKNRGPSQ